MKSGLDCASQAFQLLIQLFRKLFTPAKNRSAICYTAFPDEFLLGQVNRARCLRTQGEAAGDAPIAYPRLSYVGGGGRVDRVRNSNHSFLSRELQYRL